MSVLSILKEAVFGFAVPLHAPTDASLSAVLYEVSQAMATPDGEVQQSLDLIVSAVASILRVERSVLLTRVPGIDPPEMTVRSTAGVPRGKEFDTYRKELHQLMLDTVVADAQGMIVSEGRPGSDPRFLQLMRRLGVKGYLLAPVVRPSMGPVGVLIAATPLDGRELTDADLKLHSVMANFAGVALENAGLIKRLDRKAKKLQAIFEISRALNREGTPSALFELIVERVTELLGASTGSMILVDHFNGTLRIEAQRGLGDGVKDLRLKIGEGITGWVAKEGQAILVPDVRKEPRYIEANPMVRSEMAVPITWGDDVVGVINLDHYSVGAFSQEDLELLGTFANAAAVALKNAHVVGNSGN